MLMANKVVVLIKQLFEKKERNYLGRRNYLGLPPKPGVRETTLHSGDKTVKWLTKPSGIKNNIGRAAKDPMTDEKFRTLMGG